MVTNNYTIQAANNKNFWNQLAQTPGVDKEAWDYTVHDVLAKDMALLSLELTENGVEITQTLINDIAGMYEIFCHQLEAIYDAENRDEEMKKFIYHKAAYKGSLLSSYRHGNAEKNTSLWQ